MAQIPKLCLNMIVKNESKIILRLLQSVIPIIDTYCICDTGSTDNTIELIQTFLNEKGISGKIVNEPFRDFGYNRSFALKECVNIDAEYILLLDADMILTGPALLDPETFKRSLKDDVYMVFQGSPRFYYKNARIIRNKGYSYWGVTHEYLESPPGSVYDTIDKNQLFINDIGDGGAKSDKWERDIRLLKKGLEELPNNPRYLFYLSNSYRDYGDYKSAIEYYKKRIAVGDWIEEVWQCYYNIGKCYMYMDDMPNAIYYWLEGYEVYPKRIENLYQIVHHYRSVGKNKLAYQYYMFATNVKNIHGVYNDFLFLEKDIYDYKLDYELSIIGYYENLHNHNIKDISMKVLACPIIEDSLLKNILSNYKFYTEKIIDYKKPIIDNRIINCIKSIGKSICIEDEYVSSTPSLCYFKDNIIINTRFVNYKIDENGNYINRDKIRTKNVISVIDKNSYKITSEFVLDYNSSLDHHYIGLEDVRLFVSEDGTLLYNANRGLEDLTMRVEHGEIDLEEKTTKNSVILKKEIVMQHCEKNWVLFNSTNVGIKCVYNWYPIIIGDIQHDQFIETHQQQNIPSFFKYIRGSTNGQIIDDEIWFICHTVSYESRRYYYHIVVVLDKITHKLKKYTPFFTFEKEKVEYTLGFIEFGMNLLIGYSVLDKSSQYMMVSKDWFKNKFIEL
jgi:tetratricopeptide (TPR) repeat protein